MAKNNFKLPQKQLFKFLIFYIHINRLSLPSIKPTAIIKLKPPIPELNRDKPDANYNTTKVYL